MKLILTCEHASNSLPASYESLFESHKARLQTHEGFDIGAFEVYKSLQHLADFSSHYPWSRLLIEVNRSLNHPSLFSSISKTLNIAERNRLIIDYYEAYRHQIQKKIEETISEGETVLHLSIHSFTPILNGTIRETEFGILYDPSRTPEKTWAEDFKKELILQFPKIRVRKNYPYLGKADGFTTSLRKIFPNQYLGIELEINQKLFQNKKQIDELKQKLSYCLSEFISKEN